MGPSTARAEKRTDLLDGHFIGFRKQEQGKQGKQGKQGEQGDGQ